MLLERGFWPAGATTRNAGFACFGSAGELLDDLQQGQDEASVRELLEMRMRGLKLLFSTLGESEAGYSNCGGYEIFDHPKEQHYLDSLAELPKFNEWVKAAGGHENAYEACTYNGRPAIRNRLEGAVHSGRLLSALSKTAIQEGIEIRYNTPVERVTAHKVVLSNGLELQAGKVMTATNGFTKNLLPDSTVKPARGMVMVTKPLPGLSWRGTFHYNCGYVYFRDLEDLNDPGQRRLLIGGARDLDKDQEETTEFGINPVIKTWLCDFIDETLGLDQPWEIETEWSGIMGFGASKKPECRISPDGVYSAAGLGGMGIALGMLIGQQASEMLAGKNKNA
jgi:glycine/D-amino acid oxidase-like deaminating enzyme